MIVQWFAEMFYKVVTTLLGWINLPGLSDGFYDFLNAFLDILVTGVPIFNFFVPSSLYKVMLPIAVFIVTSKYRYFFIMWILKKIPMAGVS